MPVSPEAQDPPVQAMIDLIPEARLEKARKTQGEDDYRLFIVSAVIHTSGHERLI